MGFSFDYVKDATAKITEQRQKDLGQHWYDGAYEFYEEEKERVLGRGQSQSPLSPRVGREAAAVAKGTAAYEYKCNNDEFLAECGVKDTVFLCNLILLTPNKG